MEKIILFSEEPKLLFELISAGEEIKKKKEVNITCVVCGIKDDEIINKIASTNIDKVIVAENELLKKYAYSIDLYVDALEQIIRKENPQLFIASSTKRGREITARLAARLDWGAATDCNKVYVENGDLFVERVVFGGKCIAKEKIKQYPFAVSILPGKYEPASLAEKKAEVQRIKVELKEPKTKIIERKSKEIAGPRLEEAELIVSVGRGLKSKEDLKIIEELAKTINAVIGCSRPLSADYGWFPTWVGLSGVKVRPKVYFAIGISGAIQHVAGITDAKIIVAINKDENAPIFEVCDYGIVGDLYEAVPKLIEELRKVKK